MHDWTTFNDRSLNIYACWFLLFIPVESHKRKRDDQSIQRSLNTSMKSMSQLSISKAAVPKKTKLSPVETMPSNNEISTETNSENYTLYELSSEEK